MNDTLDTRPSAIIEHEDGTQTVIYRWNDDTRPRPGFVLAVINPDAQGDEPLAREVEIGDPSWMSLATVFMSPTDFDRLDAIAGI